MELWMIILIATSISAVLLFAFIVALVIAFIFILSYICYRRIFFSNRVKPVKFKVPDSQIYEVYRETMAGWRHTVYGIPHKDYSIVSFDGLKLCGKFYEFAPDAPIELMFHGYRGSAERDMNGGVLRSFALGHSAFLVDHRGSGKSEGHVISFGVNESRDCHAWIDFILKNVNPNAKIILTGISMGAATVMIASGQDLPPNVVGALADCGYTSSDAIIKKSIHEMKLPAKFLSPFVRMGARVYGKFKFDEFSPIESLKNAHIPILFIHGDNDKFVPYEMSLENCSACASHKKLVTIHQAGHGLCYPVDPETYLSEVKSFFEPILAN